MACDAWKWKLRLFASADLVGSTAYKASQSRSPSPDWAPTFKEFFRDFPAAIASAYQQLPQQCVVCGGNRLSPWKFLGDEILFTVELRRHEDAAAHVLAFKNAVQSFPELWAGKAVPLNLKAAAWLAGFPVMNREIEIPTEAGQTLDFLGPSIDLGFRIAKYADVRKFVLSADLALMLLDAVDTLELVGL